MPERTGGVSIIFPGLKETSFLYPSAGDLNIVLTQRKIFAIVQWMFIELSYFMHFSKPTTINLSFLPMTDYREMS